MIRVLASFAGVSAVAIGLVAGGALLVEKSSPTSDERYERIARQFDADARIFILGKGAEPYIPPGP